MGSEKNARNAPLCANFAQGGNIRDGGWAAFESSPRRATFEPEESSEVKEFSKSGLLSFGLCVLLFFSLLLWACFEVLGLYAWIQRRDGESVERFKGRLEALASQTRLLSTALFIGTTGVVALSLALVYSNRLRRMKAELEKNRSRREEMEEQSLAAAGLAHETKNPLGIIRGLAQRISEGDAGGEDIRRMAAEIMEEADITSSRLGDFLNYAGMRSPEPSEFEAGAFLERMSVLLADDFKGGGVGLKLDAAPLVLKADREMLSQLLVNLLLNSLKFTPPGGLVKVSMKAGRGGKATLEVADNGTGMPPDVAPHIFKPYYSRRAGGCGLGLAIVKRIADVSGWEIDVETAQGKGTVVAVKGIGTGGAGKAEA